MVLQDTSLVPETSVVVSVCYSLHYAASSWLGTWLLRKHNTLLLLQPEDRKESVEHSGGACVVRKEWKGEI